MSKEEAAKAIVELGGHCLLTRDVGTELGLLVILNFHFLRLGLDWEGVEDGERDRKVTIPL